jgi:hypothetical protein
MRIYKGIFFLVTQKRIQFFLVVQKIINLRFASGLSTDLSGGACPPIQSNPFSRRRCVPSPKSVPPATTHSPAAPPPPSPSPPPPCTTHSHSAQSPPLHSTRNPSILSKCWRGGTLCRCTPRILVPRHQRRLGQAGSRRLVAATRTDSPSAGPSRRVR